MPINAGPEYYLAEERYLKAETQAEKIAALEEMIRALPKHKGTEQMLSQLKRKLAKLKSMDSKKKGSKGKGIEKTGDAQICIIGETNSGKSSLLKILSGKDVEVSEKKFTTTEPEVAIFNYDGARIQLIELPSTFGEMHLSFLNTCDLVIALYVDIAEKSKLKEIIKRKRVNDKTIFVRTKSDIEKDKASELAISTKTLKGVDTLKKLIWKKLKLIRIYTKANNKIESQPVILKEASTIRNLALEIHKDLFENFSFARVFDNSKIGCKKVGLKYKLKEGDIVEIHAS